jgi:hypothetical protein
VLFRQIPVVFSIAPIWLPFSPFERFFARRDPFAFWVIDALCVLGSSDHSQLYASAASLRQK